MRSRNADMGPAEERCDLPVLVEATTTLFGQMLGPHVGESTWSVWGFDVTNGADNDNWRRVQNGDRLDDLLLVDLCERKCVPLVADRQN
jgi:hypothetical protein